MWQSCVLRGSQQWPLELYNKFQILWQDTCWSYLLKMRDSLEFVIFLEESIKYPVYTHTHTHTHVCGYMKHFWLITVHASQQWVTTSWVILGDICRHVMVRMWDGCAVGIEWMEIKHAVQPPHRKPVLPEHQYCWDLETLASDKLNSQGTPLYFLFILS